MNEFNSYGLSETEYELMKYIWASDHALTFAEILNYCNNEKKYHWAKTTLHTYLTRLIQKGVLSCDRKRARHLYFPQISEEELAHIYASQFVNDCYNGSLKDMILSFTYNTSLSKEEINELKKILDDNLSQNENTDAE